MIIIRRRTNDSGYETEENGKYLQIEEDMAERSALPKIKTNKKSKKVIQRTNKAIEQIKHYNAGFSLTKLNQLIYATLITALRSWTYLVNLEEIRNHSH